MRVGLVSPYDLSKPGGVQAQILGLAQTLGPEAVVIGPGLPDDVDGVDLGRSLSVPGNGSMVPLSLDPRVRSKLRSVDVDLLHVHEPMMPVVSLAALRAGHPVVATFHAAPTGFGRWFYRSMSDRIHKLLGPNVKAVTAVSRAAAEPLGGIDLEIVPNGVDVGALKVDLDRRSKTVAFLGRDEPRKGLDILLSAWPAVAAAHPEATLTVMGARRDTSDVEFLGRVDDETKARVLSASSVYVAPNTGGESFGIVVVEGMAAGAAVLASDLEAFRDVGGEAAAYFTTGSSADLARALIELLNDDAEVARLSAAGREKAAGFDWSLVGGRYRDIYEQALR